MATGLIRGKPPAEAMKLTNAVAAEALDGLPAHKLHCSVPAEEAIKNALVDHCKKNGLPYGEEALNCAHVDEEGIPIEE